MDVWGIRSLVLGTREAGGGARLRAIALLGGVLALASADSAAVGAIAAELEPALHIGNARLGLLVTASTLVGALATLAAGSLTDRVSRTRLLTVSVLVWGVAQVAGGFAPSFEALLVTRLALGAVVATAGPAVASLTGDLFPAGERARVYSYIVSGEFVGAGFGIIVAGLFAGWFGWRSSFFALSVPSLALAWAIHRGLPEPERGAQRRLADAQAAAAKTDARTPAGAGTSGRDGGDAVLNAVRKQGVQPAKGAIMRGDPATMGLWRAVRYVLSVRTNVIVVIASSLGYFYFAGLRTFALVFVRAHFGLSQTAATLLAVVVGVGAVGGLVIAGRSADALLARGRIDARLVVGAIAFVCAAVLLLPAILSSVLALSLPFFLFAAAGLAAPGAVLDAARLDVVPSRLWGRAEGVRTLPRQALEASAPLLFGLLSERFGGAEGGLGSASGAQAALGRAQAHGLQLTFLVMLVALPAAGALLFVARRSYPGDVAAAAESERQSAMPAPGESPRPGQE